MTLVINDAAGGADARGGITGGKAHALELAIAPTEIDELAVRLDGLSVSIQKDPREWGLRNSTTASG